MAMLNMLVQSTALEVSYFGVRVNAVAPGVTNTQARTKKNSENLTDGNNNKFMLEAGKDVPFEGEVN